MVICHACPQEIGADNWLYCGKCGVPLQLPCPYDSSHNAFAGKISGGRCKNCDRVMRYCQICGSIFTIRETSCTHCGTTLSDFSKGYDHYRGGIAAGSGVEMPEYSYNAYKEVCLNTTRKFNQRICAPISSYGSLYFFVGGSQTVLKLDESLEGDPDYSPRLGSIASPDLQNSNLSAGHGLIGVLLQDRAVLLDAVGLSIILSIPGRFSSQMFTSETYYLFGSGERAEECQAKAVDPVSGREIADFVLSDMRCVDMLRPVSDGKYVYVQSRSGKLIKIIPSVKGFEQVSRMLCEGEILGQPIILGAHLFAVASKKKLIQIGVPMVEKVSSIKLKTELFSDDICGTDGMIVVQEPGQAVCLNSQGEAVRTDIIPPGHKVKHAFVAKLGSDLVNILHLSNDSPKYESFRCWDVASGKPRDKVLRTVSKDDLPGFIVSNGAVIIFSRSKGDFVRCVIGDRA